MTGTDNNRQGSILVKFPEDTDIEMELGIYALRMGKKRITRNGKEILVDHGKADAVVELVKKGLAAVESENMPLLAEAVSSNTA